MRKTRWWSLMAFGVLSLFALSVSADEKKDKDKDDQKGRGPHASASASGSAAPLPSSSAKEKDKENVDQKKRRVDYTLSTGNKIRTIVARDKKQTTAEQKVLIKRHWRVAMRLIKIQRLAEAAGKPDRAKKAADLLAKEDARFYAKLEELNKAAAAASASAAASAPSAPSAKASTAPAVSGGAK